MKKVTKSYNHEECILKDLKYLQQRKMDLFHLHYDIFTSLSSRIEYM